MKIMGRKATTILLTILMLMQMAMPVSLAEGLKITDSTDSPMGIQNVENQSGPDEIDYPTVTFYVDAGGEPLIYDDIEHFTPDGEGFICNAVPDPSQDLWPEGALEFVGWARDGSEDPFDMSTTLTKDDDIVLYALFSYTYKITFIVGDQVVDTLVLGPDDLLIESPLAIQRAKEAEGQGSRLIGWHDTSLADSSLFHFGGSPDSSKTLQAVFTNEYYVLFISSGSQEETQMVAHGEKAREPNAPTLAGYTFKGWTTDAAGETPFSFDTAIEKNTVLYAQWTAEIVSYSVAIWLEKPGNAANFEPSPDSKSDYNYVTTVTGLTANAGGTPNLDINSLPSEIQAYFNGTQNTILKYGTPQAVENPVILGNGMTVVNLYAKRTVYTYTFNLGTRSSNTMTIGGTTYTGNSTTRFTLPVKYEMDISGTFPVQGVSFATFSSGFSSWSRGDDMTWESGAGIASIRRIVDQGMLSQNGQQKTYTLTATWNASGSSYRYRYFIEEAYPNQPAGTAISRNGVRYILETDYDQSYQGDLDAKYISGLTRVNSSWYGYNNNWGTSNSDYPYYRCFFYTRTPQTLTFNLMASVDDVLDNVPNDVTLKYGQSLSGQRPATNPTREGYEFINWYRDADYKELFDFANTTMPVGGMIAYAKWESQDHIVYFHNTRVEAAVKQVGVADGAYLDVSDSPYYVGEVVEGYGTFMGWIYDVGYGNTNDFTHDTPIMTDYHLYAIWNQTGFTVTYHEGQGTGTPPTDNKTYDVNTLLYVESGSHLVGPDGQVFYAWKGSDGKNYYAGSYARIYATNLILTAQYAPASSLAKIIYHANHAVVEPSQTQTTPVPKGAPTELAGAIFTSESATLVGWNTAEDGSGTPYALSARFDVPDDAGEIHLYGVWEINKYTVTYNKGDHGLFDDDIHGDQEHGMTTPVFRGNVSECDAGWEFTGWSPERSATVTSDVTYVAQWKRAAVTIHYEAVGNGSVSSPSEMVTASDAIAVGSTATGSTGYSFSHWSTDSAGNDRIDGAGETYKPEKPATGWVEVTYYANFVANEDTAYTVTWQTEDGTELKTPSERYGTTDTQASVAADDKVIAGYTYLPAVSTESGTIAGDGSLELKLYFTQDDYTITYEPGTQGTFEEQIYEERHYDEPTPAFNGEITGNPGYTFTGWDPTVLETVIGNATYIAQWAPNEDTPYIVSWYNADTNTKIKGSVTRIGITDETAEISVVSPNDDRVVYGYTFDQSNSKNVLTGTILGDGSLELKLYFTPNTYQITVYHYMEGTTDEVYITETISATFSELVTVYSHGSTEELLANYPLTADILVNGNMEYTFYYRLPTGGGGGGDGEDEGGTEGGEITTITADTILTVQAREAQGLFTLMDYDIPLAGMGASNMGDCVE